MELPTPLDGFGDYAGGSTLQGAVRNLRRRDPRDKCSYIFASAMGTAASAQNHRRPGAGWRAPHICRSPSLDAVGPPASPYWLKVSLILRFVGPRDSPFVCAVDSMRVFDTDLFRQYG